MSSRPGLPAIALLWLAATLLATHILAPSAALGQMGGAATDSSSDQQSRAFSMPVQPTEVTEALEDFARYRDKGTWERAFKALQKVIDAGAVGLMSRKDGLNVPTPFLIRQLLADLPPDGKNAYRLFHDAEAKSLLAESQACPAGSNEEYEKLKKLVSAYFITASGDASADRLGDLFFEQGDMSQAIDNWQSVLQFHPESSIPRVRLLLKVGVAMARSNRWNEFQEVQRQVQDRHPGETVNFGGKDVVATDYLSAIQATADRSTATDALVMLPDLELPPAVEPTWQFRMFSQADAATIASLGQNWGWGMRFPVSEMVAPAACDGARVYVNLLGYHLAVDAKNGKLLWRSARFNDLATKIQQNQAHFAEQYNLSLIDGKLYSVNRDITQMGQQGVPFRLSCLDPADGKEIWQSHAAPELQAFNLTGQPMMLGDRIMICGLKNDRGAELHLVAINAADGKFLWSTQLGTHQTDPTQNYYRRNAQPALLTYNNKVYVDTHAGALIQVDVKTGTVDWGFPYDSEVDQGNNFWGWWGYNQPQKLQTQGSPILIDGRLYFKGMKSQRLYAIDLAGPTVQWKRPVNQSAMLIGVDRDRLILGGEDLTAIDLKTQKLLWATRMPTGTGWANPVMSEHRVYQFTSRGIFEIDKQTGDQVRLFRGADLDSLGGSILLQPNMLLTVSNLAITAYRLDGKSAVANSNESASAAPSTATEQSTSGDESRDAAPKDAAPKDAAPTDAAPTDAAPTDAAPTDAAAKVEETKSENDPAKQP